MKIRLINLTLLCIIAMFLVLCCNATTISGTCGDTVWTFNEGTLIVSGEEIPDFTSEQPAPWYGYEIHTVVLEDVIKIGNYAFYECEDITLVSFGKKVESIGRMAFAYCYNLSQIEFPDSLKSIGEAAFLGCVSLSKINLASVQAINNRAFEGCFSLQSICLPQSLTTFGELVFFDNYQLSEITVEEGNDLFNSINGVLFDYNGMLLCYPLGKTETNYTTPFSCSGIAHHAFACGGNILVTGAYAHEWECPLNTVTLTLGVTTIGESAFEGRSNLQEITLPSSIKAIGTNAFNFCDTLDTINHGEDFSSTEIEEGNEVLSECNLIHFDEEPLSGFCGDNVKWEYRDKTLTISGNGDMYNYDIIDNRPPWWYHSYITQNDIEKLIIEDGVTSIGDAAFLGFTSLSDLNIANSIKRIGSLSFGNCHSVSRFRIPDSLEILANQSFAVCLAMVEFTISNNNQNFSVENGVLFNKDKTALVAYPAGKQDSLYTVPDGVTEIAPYAFYADRYTIYDGGLPIMYMNGALRELFLPDSLTKIGDYAFLGCTQLETINIPKSVTHIGTDVFYQCGCLENILYDGSEEEFAEKNVDDEWRWHYSDMKFNMTLDEFVAQKANVDTYTEETLDLTEQSTTPPKTKHSNNKLCMLGVAVLVLRGVVLTTLLIICKKQKQQKSEGI